jgi:hypothetical protein
MGFKPPEETLAKKRRIEEEAREESSPKAKRAVPQSRGDLPGRQEDSVEGVASTRSIPRWSDELKPRVKDSCNCEQSAQQIVM